MRSSSWRWRSCDELPVGSDDHGMATYTKHLEERPVEESLIRLAQAFEKVHSFLASPR